MFCEKKIIILLSLSPARDDVEEKEKIKPKKNKIKKHNKIFLSMPLQKLVKLYLIDFSNIFST